VTDAKAAAQSLFGRDSAPEGMQLSPGSMPGQWRVQVTPDQNLQAPNNIPWKTYQGAVRPEVQAYLAKNSPPSLGVPEPGKAAPVLAPRVDNDPDANKNVKVTGWQQTTMPQDTHVGARMVDATSSEVDFGKPMTKEEAAQFFWNRDNVPTSSALEPIPANAKGPVSAWRVTSPNTFDESNPNAQALPLSLRTKMNAQMNDQNRSIPEWIGPNTRAAIKAGKMPPQGVEVKHPKPGISVWREDRGVFWYNEKSGSFQSFPRKPDDNREGTQMWNNWNTSYIMDQGVSPQEAGNKVIADMDDTNRQMMLAYSSALASGRAPEEGFIGVLAKATEVAGMSKSEVIDARREYEAEQSKAVQEK
jgi:hypothetical protein